MALRQVILNARIEKLRGQMKPLNETRDKLKARREALKMREKELEDALDEVTEETSEEDRTALDEQTAQWEREDEALTTEEDENEKARSAIQKDLNSAEQELSKLNERSQQHAGGRPNDEPETRAGPAAVVEYEERTGRKNMRFKVFAGMTRQAREEFFKRETVKTFISEVRQLGRERRTVSGAAVTIPMDVLELMRDRLGEYSKLMKHVKQSRVPGKARQPVMGTVPEAVWTEMDGKNNEINLGFSMVEVDGYKVAGYVVISNAMLNDSDINLGMEIIEALCQAIGMGLDKAILYGTGSKMPLGIVTRLAQTAKPDDYPTDAPEWEDLHTANLIAISNKKGVELFQEILKAAGKAKGKKSVSGGRFWAMNSATHMTVMAQALTFNAAGALVAGMENVMPVIGGEIEELEFMPDDMIVGGFGDQYILAEREGASVSYSTEARYIEDQTVFKGVARYDGQPVIAEGFVAIGIGGKAPGAGDVTFVKDTANA